MDNKKIGWILVVFSILLFSMFISTSVSLNQESNDLGCFSSKECASVEKSLNIVNITFGVFGFMIALGFYLIFFSSDQEIVTHLKKEKKKMGFDQKFDILLLGLDDFEREVILKVKEQNGITQSTLKLRVNMSKAKLSSVLGMLENKGLIKRESFKKTLKVHLSLNW
jgi:uncharacterized membrane protein